MSELEIEIRALCLSTKTAQSVASNKFTLAVAAGNYALANEHQMEELMQGSFAKSLEKILGI